MKVLGKINLLIGLLLLLSACQTSLENVTTPIGQEPLRTVPVDVQETYINEQKLVPLAHEMTSGNLFANSGFESGLDGWTACSPGAIKTSSDAYEGSGALEVIPSNCFYKSAEVNAGDDLILSCYAKITEGSGWTGMGLGFADSNWTTIDVDIPATVITGTDYARYDVKFTAPANTKYASMWLYSDNKVVVDNCSLMLEAVPPPFPLPSGENLLENPEFFNADASPTGAEEWEAGCGGTANIQWVRFSGSYSYSIGVGYIENGACMDQSLSTSDIATLKGNDFTLSCIAKNTNGYAAISIILDGNPISKVVPVSANYMTITIQGNAGDISSGFVSLYGEGTLLVEECGLAVGSQGIEPRPMLDTRNLDRFNQFPQNIKRQLINRGNVALQNVRITSSNLPDCNLSLDRLEIHTRYDFSCDGPSLGARESFEAEVTVIGEYANGTQFRETWIFRLLGSPSAPILRNGAFESLNTDGKPFNWSKGCGGSYSSVVGRSGNGLLLTGGTCVDQPLSSGDLSTLAGKQYTYSCYAKNTGDYASMSIFFDDQPVSTVIPQSNDFQLVEVSGTAPSAGSGFLSIYSEGELTVDDCSVTVDDAQPACVDPVNIPDANLNKSVRSIVNRPTGDITCQDMLSITSFQSVFVGGTAPIEEKIFSLEGLQFAKNLQILTIANNGGITDISPLSTLVSLENILIEGDDLTDLTPLSNLPNLKTLNVNSNDIQDIGPLQSITTLETLLISSNPLTDISVLEFLPNLKSVGLVNLDLTTINSLVRNSDFGEGDEVRIAQSIIDNAPQILDEIVILRGKGVTVRILPL